MKKEIFLILFSIILNSPQFAQNNWTNIFHNTPAAIRKIIAKDNNTYFAFLGGSDSYLQSTDQGNNWKYIKAFDTSYAIYDGYFVNSQTGWIVGVASSTTGVIFNSTNGGNNWTRYFHPNAQAMGWYTIDFLNENTGWIGGWNGLPGRIIKTTNGGINWTIQDIPNSYAICKIKFIDNQRVWILGGNAGFIAKTYNAGLNWIILSNNNVLSGKFITDFSLKDTNLCYVLSYGTYPNYYSSLFKTLNGGATWDSITTVLFEYSDNSKIEFRNQFLGYMFGGNESMLKTTNSGFNWSIMFPIYSFVNLNSFLFKNDSNVIAGGGGSFFNHLYKSTNLGTNWSLITSNSHFSFVKVYFLNTNTGFVLRSQNQVFKTTNLGVYWDTVLNHNLLLLKDIVFINSNTGLIAGTDNTHLEGRLFRTTNAGNNWVELEGFSNKIINEFCKTPNNHIWAVCNNGIILQSTNGGSSWDTLKLNSNYDLKEMSFVNNSNGWIFGKYVMFIPPHFSYTYIKIFKTSNYGNNWVTTFDSGGQNIELSDLKFLNSDTGIMLGVSKFVRTTNGGYNWHEFGNTLPISWTKEYYMLNANTGWLTMPNVVYKTTNFGVNWYQQYYDNFYTVFNLFILDSSKIWICGGSSSVFYSSNGGGPPIGIINSNTEIPQLFKLFQNYPNPFNPITTIKFEIPKPSFIKITIYDILGKNIEVLANQRFSVGKYEIKWDASKYASGIYLYQLYTYEFNITKKMVLLK